MSKLAKGILFPVLFLLAWEIVMRATRMQSDSLAPPSEIAAAFWRAALDGTLAQRTYETLRAALIGLAVGGGLAVVMSIALGLVPAFARLMRFSIEALRPVPSVALIPVAILVLGFGYAMEISLIAFSAFWPVLIYGHAAIVNIEPQLLEVSRVLRLGAFGRVTKIVLPAALAALLRRVPPVRRRVADHRGDGRDRRQPDGRRARADGGVAIAPPRSDVRHGAVDRPRRLVAQRGAAVRPAPIVRPGRAPG